MKEILITAGAALAGALIPTVAGYLQSRDEKRHRVFIELLFHRIEGNAEILREATELYRDLTDNFRKKSFVEAVRSGQNKIGEAVNANALFASREVIAYALDIAKTLFYFIPDGEEWLLTEKDRQLLIEDVRREYEMLKEMCREKSGVTFLEKYERRFQKRPRRKRWWIIIKQKYYQVCHR